MCEIIDRIESYGVTLEDLEHVLKKRPGKPPGQLSEHSISLVVLGSVEERWKECRGDGAASARPS